LRTKLLDPSPLKQIEKLYYAALECEPVTRVAFENCVDAFPSSQRRGGAKRRGGQFGEIQDVPV